MPNQHAKIKPVMDEHRGEVPPEEAEPLEPGTLIIENEALRKGFTIVPNYILRDPRVSANAKVTYALLLSYAWQEGSCFPGQERLAKHIGVNKRSVIRFLQELEDRKYISRKRRGMGKTNIYYILDRKSKAEVTPVSLLEVTGIAHQDVTPLSHKEYSEYKDTVKKDADYSNLEGAQPLKEHEDENEVVGKPKQDESEDSGHRRQPEVPYSAQIAEVMTDFSRHILNDAEHAASNVTNAMNRWIESGLDEEDFVKLLYEARATTQSHSGSIKKVRANGRGEKAKGAYFFGVLKDLVNQARLKDLKSAFRKTMELGF